MSNIKYQVPRNFSFLLAANEYFRNSNYLVFLTAAGAIVGEVSFDESLHFSKIDKLIKNTAKELLDKNPDILPPDGNSFLFLKNAKLYPSGIPADEEPQVSFPELALQVDQIIAVSALKK